MDGNDLKMLAFQNWLLEVKRVKPVTANSYCSTYIGAILKVCGRRDPRNKQGKNIIRDVPFVDRLEYEMPWRQQVTRAQLDRLYQACSVATWPDNAPCRRRCGGGRCGCWPSRTGRERSRWPRSNARGKG